MKLAAEPGLRVATILDLEREMAELRSSPPGSVCFDGDALSSGNETKRRRSISRIGANRART
jgi:hypothetical protein